MKKMKTVYVLVSNGWTGYYRTKEARDRDYVSQDFTEDIPLTEDEYEKIKFEDDEQMLMKKYHRRDFEPAICKGCTDKCSKCSEPQ